MKNKTDKRDRRRRAVLKEAGLQQVHLNAAGIDIGADQHWVAVPEGRDEQHVRSFSSFTSGLTELADWLERCHVETVAMESTGVYWIPLYDLLQSRGFTVLLVNARHVKNVPGRKDDCLDCQWLQKLHTFGLLRGSFRPTAEMTTLRCFLRQRENIIMDTATWVQRMQKALTQMNLQLHHALSDITGHTGLAILRDILAGERDPKRLARHRDYRCRASTQTIVAALTGTYRDEHLFALRQALQTYDFFQQQLRDCDTHIEQLLHSLAAKLPTPTQALLPAKNERKKPRSNDLRFDARAAMFTLTSGIDVTQLPGITAHSGLRLLSEIGTDMTRFKTEKHFVSWLTLSPHIKSSGGRVLSSRTLPSANRAARLLRLIAVALRRSDTALGAFYRRLAARIGKPKAVTATARKLAILLYRALLGQLQPEVFDARQYEEQQRQRAVRFLHRRAKSLGFQLIEAKTAETPA